MNFTNSPYEKMMKEIPRPGRGGADRCAGCRPAQGGECGGSVSGQTDGGVRRDDLEWPPRALWPYS